MATVEVDDELLEEAMQIMGGASPRELVEKELREALGYRKAQLRLRELRGKIDWEGDLDELRRDRSYKRGDG